MPGKIDSLSAIRDYVLTAAAAARLGDRAAYAIGLAIDEIATNIVTHGYQGDELTGNVEVTATIEDLGLTIVVEDTGRAYDPDRAARQPQVDQPLEQRPLGGLGMFLAIHSVDRFQYDRLGNRNRHTLFIQRQQAVPGRDLHE